MSAVKTCYPELVNNEEAIKFYDKAKGIFLSIRQNTSINSSSLKIDDLLVVDLSELILLRKIREKKLIEEKKATQKMIERCNNLSSKILKL